ncbi:uncharacterized protein [Ptychodera flava]|uniref:uncharacterized protein isoform X2 n=1 Tax=Ptychodera flava TaxID=63121 RepID=UPI00396A8F01
MKFHFTNSTNVTESEESSQKTIALLPVACGVVSLYCVCFIVMYVNTWRSNRHALARQREIDSAVHVDGPPRLNSTHRRHVRRWGGLVLNPTSFFRPFIGTRRQSGSPEDVTGLHGVRTAPAVLQGTVPPKYDHIIPSDEDSSGSFATVAGSCHYVIPPSYEDAIREQEENEHIIRNESTVSSAGGLSMRTIPSQASTYRENSASELYSSREEINNGQTNLPEDPWLLRPSVGILVTFSSPLEETISRDVMEMTTH